MKWYDKGLLIILVVVVIVGIIEVADWTRALSIMGLDGSGDAHILVVDTNGNLVAVIKGDDAGTLRTIAVDSSGQLYTLIRGSGGEDIAVDANGNLAALMKGTDGVTLRTVAVDGEGNIVAVIKGDYAGTLKTLATDAYGHLQVVPFDPDDIWGYAIAMGNAELSAVISPAHRYDRRGNIVFVDSFDDGLKGWIAGGSGTGYQTVLSTQSARTGAYSVKLITGKTSSKQAGISKYRPRPAIGRVGIEGSFAPITAYATIETHLYHYTGTGYYLFQVRYNYVTQKLQYFNSAGVWTDLGVGLAFWPNYTSFNTLKVVIDLSENEYTRILFNENEYTLTDKTGYWVAGVSAPYLALYLCSTGDTVDNYTTYLDDIVFTQNEPPNE